MVDDLMELFREERTFHVHDLERMGFLPKRATVNELKEYGLVNLVHTQRRGVKPWIRHGFYKLIRQGRLYVVQVGPNTSRGQPQTAWLYKPLVRIPSSSDARGAGRNNVFTKARADVSNSQGR